MDWKRMLAYITGSVDQELLGRNEYLIAENRILRHQLQGRVRLSDKERRSLAEIGKRLGRKALAEVATLVTPDTILAWHRRLVARKFDGSANHQKVGRPRTDPQVEQLVVQMAKANPSWGYDRLVGALANLGHTISDETVGNILRRHGLQPAPERGKQTTWKEFIRSHQEVLAATDFFTAEVWTAAGLITYYILFFIRVNTREVCLAGLTAHPTEAWMGQMARNGTMEQMGFLSGCRYLLHDRDSKFSAGFDQILKSVGVEPVRLPPHSPNLNAYSERWIRSVKSECLSKLILFGERSLRHALDQYILHHRHERNHQGKDNMILFPLSPDRVGQSAGSIDCRQRLGGLLKFYHRKAA